MDTKDTKGIGHYDQTAFVSIVSFVVGAFR
jgi:hypothetical protein